MNNSLSTETRFRKPAGGGGPKCEGNTDAPSNPSERPRAEDSNGATFVEIAVPEEEAVQQRENAERLGIEPVSFKEQGSMVRIMYRLSIDVCMDNDRDDRRFLRISRPPVGRPHSLAMQASIIISP